MKEEEEEEEEEEKEKAQILHKSASAVVFSFLVVDSWNLLSAEFLDTPSLHVDITSYYIKPGHPTADKSREKDGDRTETRSMGK